MKGLGIDSWSVPKQYASEAGIENIFGAQSMTSIMGLNWSAFNQSCSHLPTQSF